MEIDYRKLKKGAYESDWLDTTRRAPYSLTDRNNSIISDTHVLRTPICDYNTASRLGKKPIWPNNKDFAVCLTHDVDHPSPWNPILYTRQLRKRTIYALTHCHRKSLASIKGAVFSLARSISKSPPNNMEGYEKWLDIESQHKAKSTFLFLPARYSKSHYSDCCYNYEDTVWYDRTKCSIRDMIRDIHHRGWEIGLHASWHSVNSSEEMIFQKHQIEGVIDEQIQSVRQHHLHFDIRHTPSVHEKSHLRWDSSIGFNNEIGFRYGTCYPFFLYDFQKNRFTRTMEIPLIIQEKALIRYAANNDRKRAFRAVEEIIRHVKEVKGILTLLWHPSTIYQSLYRTLYEDALSVCQDNNAWFATMSQTGDWWTKNNLCFSDGNEGDICD